MPAREAGVTALLDGADADRAGEVVAEIAAALAPGTRIAGASLCRGAAGVALFLAELALATGDGTAEDAAAEWLDAAVVAAAGAPPTDGLYTGTVGVGWLLGHLDGRLVDAAGAADEVDGLVADALARDAHRVDLVDGLAGLGVYLLARLPRPSARDGLDRVVAHLARLAAPGESGVTWPARPEGPEERALYPDGYTSLGMAHGQAGIVALLARLHGLGVTGAAPLLAEATKGLLAQRRDDAGGRYPALVPRDRAPDVGSRLAWCYGDPGVAVALLAAGRALRDPAVEAEALATARGAAARTFDGSLVVDAGLCHGSAGLLHLFGVLARATGDPAFAAAAQRWYGVLLGQRVGAAFAGFRAVLDVGRGPEPAGGFLEGAAGVGLALLAATRPEPMTWDVLLLA